MSNFIRIQESQSFSVELTTNEVTKLRDIGRSLSSSTVWWTEEEDSMPDRSLVEIVNTNKPGTYKIKVMNAIGVLNLGSRFLIIEPKITASHFIYIASASIGQPRLSPLSANLAEGNSVIELLANWYLSVMESITKAPLAREYESYDIQNQSIRGSLHVVSSTRNFYRGQIEMHMEADELSINTSLNRVLKSALIAVSSWSFLSESTRSKASKFLAHFDGVEPFQKQDLEISIYRNQYLFKNAFELASSILRGSLRELDEGRASSISFLLPTPLLIQRGVTAIVRDGLQGFATVEPKSKRLFPSSFSVNPDLVFERRPSFVINSSLITGDVKYKIDGSKFNRADFYQAVTFATAFESPGGLVVTFAYDEMEIESTIQIGRLHITRLRWNVDPLVSPQQEAEKLVRDIRQEIDWLIKGKDQLAGA